MLGIAGLLVTIAAMQYRWTKQLSTAMETQVRSNLDSLMTQWGLDLYGNLSGICIALQVGPDSGAHEGWHDYLGRLILWNRANAEKTSLENLRSNPALIQAIYIWETSERQPRLHLLNAQSNRIEDPEIPKRLEPLLARLRERSQSLPAALRAWELARAEDSSDDRLSRSSQQLNDYPMTGWQFDESIPAIVHPLVDHDRPDRHVDTVSATPHDPVDWIVIVLDRQTIEQRIFPELAKRYFSGQNGLEYKLAVMSAQPSDRKLYSSDENFPGSTLAGADSVMNIFGPPPQSIEGHAWESLRNAEQHRHSDWHSFSGPGWFPVIEYQGGTQPWLLVVKRRGGSLAAVVTRVWRTNLMTGLALLLLLAVSVTLVLLASQRLNRIARLQMNFVASVSHELRTPLTVMIAAAENLSDGIVAERGDVREHGGIITRQGRILMDLMDRILLFAASSAGKTLQSLRPVEIAEVIKQVRQNVERLLPSVGVRIEENVPVNLPRVQADPIALAQSLQNLLVNAIKYRGSSDWIGLSAELHEAPGERAEVRIHVADRGLGIKQSELLRIFDPFYRSPDLLSTHVQGTGLGLTVAKRSITDMGGRLTVVSTFGQGSTFTIHLPVATVAEPVSEMASEAVTSNN